jgi:predicted site-specific integrase-resolvase
MSEQISLRRKSKIDYDPDMEARVAVLEQIAKDTKEVLVDIKGDLREIRKGQKMDFLWLLGSMGLMMIIVTHGFRWF